MGTITLNNIPFSDINIGDRAEYKRTITTENIQLFAQTSGDINPVHLDEDYAKQTPFGQRIAHGMWSGAIISAAIATTLPGPGSIYRSQTLKFLKPAHVNDELTVQLEVIAKKDRIKLITLQCIIVNQDGVKIATGTAEVIASDETLTI